MVMSSILKSAKSVVFLKFPRIPLKTPSSLRKMSSWACSSCTFINPPSQKLRCEICLTAPQSPLLSSSSPLTTSAISLPSKPMWSCAACTFLNPYHSSICEICGTRASASLRSTLEVDDDDLHEARLGSSIGSVFLPLRGCSNTKEGSSENPDVDVSVGGSDTTCSGVLKSTVSPLTHREKGNFGSRETQYVGNGGSGAIDSRENKGFSAILRPCGVKRKNREETGVNGGAAGSSGFSAVNAANKAIEVKSSGLDFRPHVQKLSGAGVTTNGSKPKTWKILSYNIWFREDLEMRNRMKALGNLIELHSPDVICFQEVTPSFYEIFQQARWWKGYRCSIANEMEFPGGYFCMQLSKLPVKSYSCKPFHNSIMGRQLCIAEVEIQPSREMVVATSHLESPCPSPPKWDQMFSKERVAQATEAINFLDKNQNVIFCGDMNWDDKLDGGFPLPDGWVDAWTELKPGEVGFTYDTKSNKMLSGNRSLQKRLDRFACKLKDFKMSEIEMIGMDAIPELSYVKEKRVKGQVKELVLPVLPSDHYGLLLTICDNDL